jgi:hypothetical protein
LILVLGQRLVGIFSRRATKLSTDWKKKSLTREYIARRLFWDNDLAVKGFTLCIYQGLRFGFRGLVFLTLGLISSEFIPVFGVIGYLGGIYFFLRAAWWVASFEDTLTEIEHWERVAELEKKMYGHVKSDTKERLQKARSEQPNKPA